jgi:NitT/TauT family transport system substrate-binding protein
VIVGLVIAVLVIGGFWYFASNKQEAKLETTKVKIANLPVVQGLPLYLAIEKGYFKDAGLEVELVKFEAPNQIIDALLQGQVDLTSPSGAMGITGIADFKNPGKLKIYAAGGGDTVIQNDAILVKNDSSIKSFQDLKGKKLGIVAGSIQWRTIARDILAKNNLEADKDVILVELALGLQAQALATGQVDALLGIEPIPTIVKSKGIGKEIVDHLTTKFIADPFYAGAGIVRVDFAKQNPNTTKKVLDILHRAINEINQNPDSARQYLKGYTALDETAIAQVPISRFKFYSDFTQDEISAVQKFYDIFSNFKVVDGKMDFQKLLYSPNEN